jgi:hypothetical protein
MEGGWSLHSPALARIHDRVHDMFPHAVGFLDDSIGKETQPIPQQLRVLWFREMSFVHHSFGIAFLVLQRNEFC